MSGEVVLHCAGMVTQYGELWLGYVVALSKCVHSSSIDSRDLVFVYRGLGSLLHYLRSMYNIFSTSNSPDSASMCSNDLVSPSGGADTCMLHFQSSLSTWWVQVGVGLPVVLGRWIGWLRYIACHVLALLMLIFLICS